MFVRCVANPNIHNPTTENPFVSRLFRRGTTTRTIIYVVNSSAIPAGLSTENKVRCPAITVTLFFFLRFHVEHHCASLSRLWPSRDDDLVGHRSKDSRSRSGGGSKRSDVTLLARIGVRCRMDEERTGRRSIRVARQRGTAV